MTRIFADLLSMMNGELLLKGIFLGLALAAPVGPIGLLCIQRTLNEGGLAGLVSGLGATAADTIYGCIAGFGITFIANFLTSQQQWLRLIGGVFICYLGLKIFASKPAKQAASSRSAACLALSLDVLMIQSHHYRGFHDHVCRYRRDQRKWRLFCMMALVRHLPGLGALVVDLCGGVSLFRAKLTPRRMRWVNRIAGVVIVGFGVTALWNWKS
jgi:threonine/homoserine/homoserine lactone efflux protein